VYEVREKVWVFKKDEIACRWDVTPIELDKNVKRVSEQPASRGSFVDYVVIVAGVRDRDINWRGPIILRYKKGDECPYTPDDNDRTAAQERSMPRVLSSRRNAQTRDNMSHSFVSRNLATMRSA
jgi:hypothetical protein